MASAVVTPIRTALLVACSFFIVLLPFVGLGAIGGSSEARETHIAAIMLETGEWILPFRNGIVPSKPPLFHWVTALLGELRGGVTPGVARATSLLFGAATVFISTLLAAGLTSGIPGMSAGKSRGIALLSAFILASTYGFTQLAIDARVDMTFSFWVVLAVYALVRPFSRTNVIGRGRTMPLGERDFALFFLACGFAVLAKGPIGLVLPAVVGGACLAYLAGVGRALRASLRPRWSWLLFLAIAVPWSVLAANQGGDAFIERQLLFENMKRFVGAEHMNNQPPWFYIGSFLRGAFPWSLVFLAHLGLVPLRRSAPAPYGADRIAPERVRAVGAVWFAAGFLFLSLAAGKRHSYLLPLYPGLSIFTAWCTVDLLGRIDDDLKAKLHRLLECSHRVLGGLVFAAAGALAIFLYADVAASPIAAIVQRWLSDNRFHVAAAFAVVLVPHIAWFARLPGARRWTGLSAAITAVWLLGCGIAAGYGVKSELKGFDRMAAAISAQAGTHSPLTLLKNRYDEYFDPFLFYLKRAVTVKPLEAGSIACPTNELFLARFDWFSNFEAEHPGSVVPLATVHQAYDELKGLLSRGIVLFRCRTDVVGALGDRLSAAP